MALFGDRRTPISTLIVATLLSVSFYSNAETEPEPPVTQAQVAVTKADNFGVDTKFIAKDVQAGDDFYRYVNKGWLDTTKMPQGRSKFNGFTEVELKTEQQINVIIQELIKQNAPVGTPAQRLADLYKSYTDIAKRNRLGFDSLKGELSRILNAKNRTELAALMGGIGHDPLFSLGVEVDASNPERYILMVGQAGLTMGSDYYLKNAEPFIGHRAAYLKYIEGVLQRAGISHAKKQAKAILNLETAIAKCHWTPEQSRDMQKLIHDMSKEALKTYAPDFDWTAFFKAAGYEETNDLQVSNDSAIKALSTLFAKTPIETLRVYMAFHYLNNHAELLSEPWNEAKFDLFSRRLNGIAKQRTLEERAIVFINSQLEEEIGKLYVERYFPADAKAKMQEMVGFLQQTFDERLKKADWMDAETRKQALDKLAKIKFKIAYPDQWHDFNSVKIAPDDLVGNVHQIETWWRNDQRAKLHEPIRTWEWLATPQATDAFYLPTHNEILFPAGILQAPFFNPDADPAVNFGAIGMVIGHELGHAFDDQGSRFDGNGQLRNWWADTARKNFDAKTQRLVTQYNGYSPIKGVQVNGQLTLGENIGDLGGITIAFDAYQKYLANKYPNATAPVIAGFSGNQRFFLGFAQVWRSLITDDALRQQVLTNNHSPSQFRVNGVLRNFDPWYEAFGVTEKNKLYLLKDQRIRIW